MIISLASLSELESQDKNKVVIVGAGTVGIYLAYCLMRTGKSVLLVDAGDRVANAERNEVAITSVGIPHSGYRLGRAFGLGGTSVLWGGQLAEFESADFLGWPLPFEKLHHWYDNVYKDMSIVKHSIESYRNRLGYEVANDQIVERFFTHWLRQPNFARLFRKRVIDHQNVPVILNTTARGIKLHETGQAYAVSVKNTDNQVFDITGSDFVFCNGTIETARLFLSTQVASDVPWKHNKHIGKSFQDHRGGSIGVVDMLSELKFRNFFENAFIGGAKIQPKLRYRSNARNMQNGGICGLFSFRSDIEEHYANIKMLVQSLRSGVEFSSLSSLPRDITAMLRLLGPIAVRFIRDRRIMAFFDRSPEFLVQCEQRPIAESQIRLGCERHPVTGLFAVDIDWQVDDDQINTIKGFAHHADHYLQANGLARLRIDERLEAGDKSFLESLRDTYHQAGGMCMSASPSAGVVDSNCCVWGTSNVYVAGASVFPSSSYTNITFTALALAARLGSFLGTKR